jgi:hypothetical protein
VSNQDTHLQPPQPPDFNRRFQLYPYQYIAIPLLFVIPILALLGAFGQAITSAEAANTSLAVHVKYESRMHYQLFVPIVITVTNQTDETLSDVRVYISRDYLDGFSQITLMPAAETITDTAYVIELQTLEPNETQTVTGDIRAHTTGRYMGSIRVEATNAETVSVSLESIVFP